jgi:5-methylcytosine-specific restriction endonuclease McrA
MSTRNSAKRDLHRRILRRLGADCAICHAPIDYTLPYLHPLSFVADHIIPDAKGGPDTLDNKQASHRRCNRDKSDAIDYDPTTKHGVTIKRVRAW